jgi:uncharacterized protein (TIGR03437 family)
VRVLICPLLTLSCFGANSSTIIEPGVLAFEARDQQYVSQGSGYALTVTSRGAVLSLAGRAVRMSIAGVNPKASLETLDRMPGKANYFLGRDFRESYDLFGRVRWRGVYPGINVVFRGNLEHLEYDLEIGASHDPGRIRLTFDGIDDIQIDRNGDLVLSVGAAKIHQPNPFAYQVVAGKRQPVDAAYWIDASNHVRFRTGAYDRARTLVIDPQIVFDKSFGGSGTSTVAGLARDAQGNLYVAGTTNSTDFSTTLNALQNKLGTAPLLVTANAGQNWTFPSLSGATSVGAIAAAPSAPLVLYAATPIGVFKSADGGTTWSATANTGLVGEPNILAVDASSPNTVYAATAQQVFVSTDGAASWRTSTGGLTGTGILTIAAHPSQAGTVFASVQNPPALFRSTDSGQTWTQLNTGSTSAPNAIVVAPNGTIFAATTTGLLISTDGGNTFAAGASQGTQNSRALAIAPGNPATVYLFNSLGLQKSSDGGQTFTVVLANVVNPDSAQYVGPFAVDPRNPNTLYAAVTEYANTTVTFLLDRSTDAGQTWTQVPLPYSVLPELLFVSPADSRVFVGATTQNNVFVTKWSADGSQVLYSTYLGGNGSDSASGIAVDGTGSAYVTGFTTSPNFPTTPGAFNTTLSGAPDVFAAKLSPDGSQLVYSTLLGSGSEFGAIAVDATGNAVITGLTQGNFPVTANAFQATPGAGCSVSEFNQGSAFVTRIAADGKSLLYSTFLGGSCPATNIPLVAPAAYGTSVALDASGNAWVTGSTLSTDFPVTSDALQPKFGGGIYDGYLARFNPNGGLEYATYLGGPGYDTLVAIAFDPSGNVYLAGETAGLSQAASAGAFQSQANASCPTFNPGLSFPTATGNALVIKLDSKAHSVLGLTYLGAPLCLAPTSIAVDSAGEPWIAGGFQPYPSAPPTVSPLEIGIGQGFISKFSADFTQLLFSTYFAPVSGVTLDSSGLAYVAGADALNTSAVTQQVYLAKIDPTPPAISLDSVVSVVPSTNSSGFMGIAPGEVIRILGKQMGPAVAPPPSIQSGVLATNVAGVQVTFDGTAVPLLSVSAQEIDLVVPFELATKSTTTVQVVYNGVQSNPVQVAVTPTALQILGVFNEDFSPNSASNPAKAGSVIILYLAGAGQTNPPSQDGRINVAPLAAPGTPIQIESFNNGMNILPITFAGAAPGLAAGILQINFVAPQQSSMNVSLSTANSGAQFNVFVQ